MKLQMDVEASRPIAFPTEEGDVGGSQEDADEEEEENTLGRGRGRTGKKRPAVGRTPKKGRSRSVGSG